MSMRGNQLDRRILFWREETATPLLLGAIGSLFGVKELPRPQDFVRTDIPYDDRIEVARVLELRCQTYPRGGQVLMGYMGWADCRICGARLGTRDLFGYGFIWPEKAEHYVMNHNVWNGDCVDLLMAVRRRQQ